MRTIVYTGAAGVVQMRSQTGDVVAYRGAAGQTAEVPDDIAAALIDIGQAEAAPAKPGGKAQAKH